MKIFNKEIDNGWILLLCAFFLWFLFVIFNDNDAYVIDNYENSTMYDIYGCTGSCAGHKAGFEWAMEKGITNPDDCGGRSESFIEGCKAYAVDH